MATGAAEFPDVDRSGHEPICDVCDRLLVHAVVIEESDANWLDRYELPDDIDAICHDCAREENQYTPETMTEDELIAAIVAESHGYASPGHAAQHVEDFREGRTGEDRQSHCERLTSQCGGDILELIDRAHRYWICQSDDDQERYLEIVDEWRSIETASDTSNVNSMAISMQAPLFL